METLGAGEEEGEEEGVSLASISPVKGKEESV